MKKMWKACTFVIIGIAVILFFSVYQKSTPTAAENNSLVGTWQDAPGLTKYTFMQDGKMKIQALNIGSFKGNYNTKDNKITMEYNVIVKKEKNTYTYQLKDNKLYLDGKVFTRKK